MFGFIGKTGRQKERHLVLAETIAILSVKSPRLVRIIAMRQFWG